MDKVPGYESAVRLLVKFMINPNGDDDSSERMSAVEASKTLGLERARNLAIHLLRPQLRKPESPTFDWTPLWRHQITVGIVMDFLYDALDLKRSGFEYVTAHLPRRPAS